MVGAWCTSLGVGGGSGNSVVLECVGIQRRTPHELVCCAVVGVGAALQHHIHNAAAGVAIFRVVNVGHHVELLHGIHNRYIGDVVATHLTVVGGAVEEIFGG